MARYILTFFTVFIMLAQNIFAQASKESVPVAIPSDLGTVENYSVSNNGRLIIHIQDAHCYYPVQQQIVKLIEHLSGKYGINHIFVEGADSRLNADRMKSCPDEQIRKIIADYFLKEGKISGVEYLVLEGKTQYNAEGIEDRELYRKNYTAFTESQGISAEVSAQCEALEKSIDSAKSKIYSHELLNLDKNYCQYLSGQITLRAFALFIIGYCTENKIDLNDSPNLKILKNVLNLENKLDYSSIEIEKNKIISVLQQKLTPEDKIKLLDATLNYSLEKISSTSLFKLVLEYSKSAEINFDEYPSLNVYINYLDESDKISSSALDKELLQVVESIKEKIFVSEDERIISRLDKFAKTLKNIACLRANTGDLIYYRNEKQFFSQNCARYLEGFYSGSGFSPSILNKMSRFDNFYKYATDRDCVIVQNTISKMDKSQINCAVLITGGFHSDGIRNIFESKGITYICVKPKFFFSSRNNSHNYESVILGSRNSLENFLITQWGSLAVANVLVEGMPLVQEWKSKVYDMEMGITALVAKMAALKIKIQAQMGVKPGSELTDVILNNLVSQIGVDGQKFIALWNDRYRQIAGTGHPFLEHVETELNIAGNDLYLNLKIDGREIIFPLVDRFYASAESIINSYLTPEKFASIVAGAPSIRESAESIDQIKNLREKINDILINPQYVSGYITEEEKNLIYSISTAVMESRLPALSSALSEFNSKTAREISEVINRAISNSQANEILSTLAQNLTYSKILDKINYGSLAPIMIFSESLKESRPALSEFARFVSERFGIFSDAKDLQDIQLALDELLNRYIIDKKDVALSNFDTMMIDRIAKIVFISLKLGDGIRPHGVVAVFRYAFGLLEGATFEEGMLIHDLLERESIYTEDQVIRLLLNSMSLNEEITRVLISRPLPFDKLLELIKSDSLKFLRESPTPFNFARFNQKYGAEYGEPFILKLFSGSLAKSTALKAAVDSLIEEGYKDNQKIKQFSGLAVFIKNRHLKTHDDKLKFDLILLALSQTIENEMLMTESEVTWGAVTDFARMDSLSPDFDESVYANFFRQVKNSGDYINIMAYDPGFPSKMDGVTTPVGIEISLERYRMMLGEFLQSASNPVFLFAEPDKIDEVKQWLSKMNLNIIAVVIPYDYRKKDLALNWKKKLDFLGYWFNLSEVMVRGYRGRVRFVGIDDYTSAHFENFGRDYLTLDRLTVNFGKPAEEELVMLASKGKTDILSSLSVSPGLNKKVILEIIKNEFFKPELLTALLKNNSVVLDEVILEAISKRFYPYQFSDVFASVQNMRSAMLFYYISRENPKIIGNLIGQMDTDKLADIMAHATKLGFEFDTDTLPDNLYVPKMKEFVEKFGPINPASAAQFIKTATGKDIEKGRELIEKISQNADNQTITGKILLNLINAYAQSYPDFQELIPFLESDVTPLWHKGFIVSNAVMYLNDPPALHRYIYAILDVFSQQGDFAQWVQLNISKHKDRVEQWIKAVSVFPEVDELRTSKLLNSAIMTDKHILMQYADFISNIASKKEIYSSLLRDKDEFNRIFHAVNSVFALPIETKMHIFNIIPFIHEFLPQGMNFTDVFGKYVEKTDQSGNVIEKGIPVYCILQAVVFSEGNTDTLDSFKQLFSSSYIGDSVSAKMRMASNFLRVFSELNHANIHSILKPDPAKMNLFFESIKLSTTPERRQEIFDALKVPHDYRKGLTDRFDKASRKRLISIESAKYSRQGFTKKDQKSLTDVIDFMFILSDNYKVLAKDDPDAAKKFDAILAGFAGFENVRKLRAEVMKVFAMFIRLDFPDLFADDEQLMAHIDKIEEVKNYWKYKVEWEGENPQGIELMRKAVEGYLRDGSSLKSIKYGGTLQTQTQIKILKALLTQTLKEKFIKDGLSETESAQKADELALAYIHAWTSDYSDRIDLKNFPALKRHETIVAWTSDETPDWLRFGLSGGGTCLAPGNVTVYTKNLPGYMFSALVSGGLYLGKFKGDTRDRVNQALMPVAVSEGKHRLYIVNQYYYSSGGDISEDIGIASVIVALRNAALFGADGVIIPTGSPQSGYIGQMKDFLKNQFSSVVDIADESGRVIGREKITVDDIDWEEVKIIVPEEPNRWRYFDATEYSYGKYPEKMNENFSYVDFDNAVAMNVAGINFNGLTVTSKAIVIKINRRQMPLEKTEIKSRTLTVSDEILDFIKQDRLIVLGDKISQINEYLTRISTTDRTTGKYLNLILQVSELLSRELNSKYVQRNIDSQYVVLSIANNGVPIARKLGEMLDGLDYVNGQISDNREKDYIPDLADINKPRTVFLVDEAITTGNTAVKNIELVLQRGICMPEEIVLVALTADPQAVGKLLRKYPDIKIVVGVFEQRMEQDGVFVSELVGGLTDKTQPLDMISEKKVKVGGIEYKILDRFQRGQSFVVYTAETSGGSKVILKTTVSEDEGSRFTKIWELVSNHKPELGVPKVHQYDEKTGILVSSFISGPTLANYIRQEGKPPSQLALEFLNAIHDALEVAAFLNKHNALYVNITLNNLRQNPSNTKWYLTNYTPFPYRIQPLPEEGVVSQIGYIIEQALSYFNSYSGTYKEHDRRITSDFAELIADIKSGKISSIDRLDKKCREIILPYLTLSSLGSIAGINLDFLSKIIDENDYPVMAKLYDILRSNKYRMYHVVDVLKMLSSHSAMNTEAKNAYILEKLEALLDSTASELKVFGEAKFLYMDIAPANMRSFFAKSAGPGRMKKVISDINKRKEIYRLQIRQAIDSLKIGQPVFLAGSYDALKWAYNEIYAGLGQKPENVFLIPDFLKPGQDTIPARLEKKNIVNAANLFFANTYKKEGSELILTEATIFDITEIASLFKADDKLADHLRLRIVKNPGMNFVLRTAGNRITGLISYSFADDINRPVSRTGWESSETGKMPVNYSSAFSARPVFSRYESIRTLLETHLSAKFQARETYRYFYPQNFIEHLVRNVYIPYLKSIQVSPYEFFKTAFRDNNPESLAGLFPDRAESISGSLVNIINKLWDEKSQTYKDTLARDGEKTLTALFLKDVFHELYLINDKQIITRLVSDLFGLNTTVFDYLSSSYALTIKESGQIDRLYEEYLSNPPTDTVAMDKIQFERIIKSRTGDMAFKDWIGYHNPELLEKFNKINAGQITSDKDFTEQFGMALSQFALYTGRRPVDPDLGKSIAENGVLVSVIENGWGDPLSPDAKINGLGYALISRFSSHESDENNYIFNNFSKETETNLKNFIRQLSESQRTRLLINLNSIDFDKNFRHVEYAVNLIFSSSVPDTMKFNMLMSDLAKHGQSIESVYGNKRVVFVNADSEHERINVHSMISNTTTAYLFVGTYENVYALYNHLNNTASNLEFSRIEEVKSRIAAFLPFVDNIPDSVSLSRFGQVFNFGRFEDTVAVEKISSLPVLPDLMNISAGETPVLSSSSFNFAIADLMGKGGVLSAISSGLNKKIDEINRYAVYMDKVVGNTVFLRLTIEYKDAKFESIISMEIKSGSQLKPPSAVSLVAQPPVPFSTGGKIINAIERKYVYLPSNAVAEFTFYNSLPYEDLSLNDRFDPAKITELNQAESVFLRKLVRIQTGLWRKYGLTARAKPQDMVVRNINLDLYLLLDLNRMSTAMKEEDFLFNLVVQDILPFSVSENNFNSWLNGEDTPFELKKEVFDGILDGLNGDTELFRKFADTIIQSNPNTNIASAVSQYSRAKLAGIFGETEINQLSSAIYVYISSALAGEKGYFIEALTNMPEFERYPNAAKDVINYTKRLIRNRDYSVRALKLYLDNYLQDYRHIDISSAVMKMREKISSLIDSPGPVNAISAAIVAQSNIIMDQTVSAANMKPSQLLITRILLNREIYAPEVENSLKKQVPNPIYYQLVYEVLGRLEKLLKDNPDTILRKISDLSAELNVSDDLIYSLFLPNYDPGTKSFGWGIVRVNLSAVPLLLKAEKILRTTPVLMTGDSSSLNFQVFEQIKSVFKIPAVDIADKFGLKNWISNQDGAFVIDLADNVNRLFMESNPQALMFDIRKYCDLESLLKDFVFQFESEDIRRLSFYINSDVLDELNLENQSALDEILRHVIQLKIKLHKALSGNEADKSEYFKYAGSIGLSDKAGSILYNAQIQPHKINVTALILDGIAQSKRFPEINDLLSGIRSLSGFSDGKLLVFLDVYSRLAIGYFARQLSDFSSQDEVHVDFDLGAVESAGKKIIDLDQDHKFVLELFRSAKIGYMSFKRGTPVETIITYCEQIKTMYPLFGESLLKNIQAVDTGLGPEDMKHKYLRKLRYESLMDSSV